MEALKKSKGWFQEILQEQSTFDFLRLLYLMQ